MIQDLIVIGSIFFPLFCILIMLVRWKGLKQDITMGIFDLGIAFLVLISILMRNVEWPQLSSWIEYYLLFAVFYSFGILWYTKRLELSYIFPVAGMMVFVAADLWELPIFIYGNLHLFNPIYQAWAGQWFDQIHRFYALGVFICLLKLSGWKLKILSVAFLTASLVYPFMILSLEQLPDFWPIMLRIVTLNLFGAGIILGLKRETNEQRQKNDN